MATPCKPGGYTYRRAVNDIRRECQAARRSLQELIAPERPGPALTALHVARIGTSLAAIQEALADLERIGSKEDGSTGG